MKMFTLTFLVGDSIDVDLSLWIFAARNSFIQLESYCWSVDIVKCEVIEILADKGQGLVRFVQEEGLSLAFMSGVVARIIVERSY
jgi:hypothetical protein